LEPTEFGAMVAAIRRVTAMRGGGVKAPLPEELDTAKVARRSVVAAVAISEGTRITDAMLACRRPATGIPPRDMPRVVGRVARTSIEAGTVLQWKDLEGGPGR